MVAAAQEAFGRVDILVNNAGWTGTTPALDVTEDEYDRTMAASLKSVFFACQAAARVMIPQGGGKIVNIGSNFGVVAFQGRSVYAAAKAGVHHLSRALSLEWAKHGVIVNVVAPCITETDSRKVHPRTAGLQGVGDEPDAARRPLESAGRPRRRGAVPVERTCPTWSSATCSWSTAGGRCTSPSEGFALDSPASLASRCAKPRDAARLTRCRSFALFVRCLLVFKLSRQVRLECQ